MTKAQEQRMGRSFRKAHKRVLRAMMGLDEEVRERWRKGPGSPKRIALTDKLSEAWGGQSIARFRLALKTWEAIYLRDIAAFDILHGKE